MTDSSSYRPDLPVRERVRLYGKRAVELEEMVRLGFWPPDDAAIARADEARAELACLASELRTLAQELAQVDEQIEAAKDVDRLLAEIRRRRIERVGKEREDRRERRAAEREERSRRHRAWRSERPPFLGYGVSAGLRYDGGDDARLRAAGLPQLHTAGEIARAMGVEEREVAWLTYHRAASIVDHYHRFTIPKRTGGTRLISSPKTRLRMAQTWLLGAVLAPLSVHEAATAFRPGRSILHNALQHTDHAVVVRIDLRDFFPSISFRRVKGLFQSLGYNEGVATIFALLSTDAPRVRAILDGTSYHVATSERCLPQGASTSPAITNVLCSRLDARLSGLASSFGFRYTRYADDIVFSHADDEAMISSLLPKVRQIIADEGFAINEQKTRVMRRHQRQAVTGLVVNEGPHIPRSDLRNFRSFLHHCEHDGFESTRGPRGTDSREYAKGYLAFIRMVSPLVAERILRDHSWLSEPGLRPSVVPTAGQASQLPAQVLVGVSRLVARGGHVNSEQLQTLLLATYVSGGDLVMARLQSWRDRLEAIRDAPDEAVRLQTVTGLLADAYPGPVVREALALLSASGQADPTASVDRPVTRDQRRGEERSRPFSAEAVRVELDGTGTHRVLADAIRTAAPGATIHLGPGKHLVAGGLDLSRPLRLVGSGMDATEITSQDGPCVLAYEGSGEIALSDLTLRWIGSPSADVHVAHIAAETVHIERCRFAGAPRSDSWIGSGLALVEGTVGSVSHCFFEGNATALHVRDTARVDIDSSTFLDSLTTHIVLLGTSQSILRLNVCANSRAHGIFVGEGAAPTLEENTCRNNAGNGIMCADNSRANLFHNICSGNLLQGIWIGDHAQPTLNGNQCLGNKQSGIAYVDKGSGKASDNRCVGNEVGIYVDAGASPQLTSNNVTGNRRDDVMDRRRRWFRR